MNRDSTMEAITRLAVAGHEDCDCGCRCAGRGAVPAKQQELPWLPLRVAASAGKDVPGRSRPDGAVGARVRRR
jgi:hypothetical protein